LSRSAPIELPLAQALDRVAADCRHSRRFRRTPSPRPMAGRFVPATSSARRPIRRCHGYGAGLVEAGAAIPQGCDCVIDTDLVDQTGPMAQVLAEAIPGQGVRRMGGDIADGSFVIASGRRVRPLDLLIARAAGLED